jgi:hypothetical protein
MGKFVGIGMNVKVRQAVCVVIGGCVVGIVAQYLLDAAILMGRFIPQRDIVTDYVTAFCWAMVLGACVVFFPVTKKDRSGLLFVWFVKIIVTLGFMLVYENNYMGLDSYNYFSRPQNDAFLLTPRSFYGTSLVDNIVWIHQSILPHSYHMLKVSFSFIGMISIYIFYRAVVIFIQREDVRVFYILSLFPSILFWSSIVGKDPFILLGLSLHVYGVVAWNNNKSGRYFIVLILGIIFASLVRIWMAPIFLIPIIVLVLFGKHSIGAKAIVTLIITAIMFVSAIKLQQVFLVESLNDIVAATNDLSHKFARGNTVLTQATFSSFGSIAQYAPIGMFTALYRPLPGEAMNLFGVFAGIENLFLLGLSFLALKRSRFSDMKDPVILWAIAIIIVWSFSYGFISYNLGTIARYKSQILPLLLSLALYQVRKR